MIIYSPTFTGSVQITGSQTVTGDLTVQGNLTAQTFILSSSVSYFTESFASGSTRFGDSMDDTMKVTGSLLVTGSGTFASSVTTTQLIASTATNTSAIIAGVFSGTNNPRFFVQCEESTNTIKIIGGSSTGSDNMAFGVGGAINNIFIKAGGNVGIGTSSPDLTLSINGAMNLRNSTRAGAFEIDSSGNLWMGTATTLGNLYFETGHSTTGLPSTGTARMIITGGGNVGIGTSSPAAKLEIQDGHLRLYNAVSTAGAGYAVIWASDSGGTNTSYATIEAATTTEGVRRGDIKFNTSNAGAPTEKMRITSAGRVGIGTTNPSQILDIQSSSVTVKMLSTTGTNAVYTNYENAANFYVGRDSSVGDVFGGSPYAAVLYSSGAYPMEFWTSSTRRMIITSGGNLLIRTTTDVGQIVRIYQPTNGQWNMKLSQTNGSDQKYIEFLTTTDSDATVTSRGNIYYNGTNVLYIGTSDYRLKEDLQEYNGLSIVSQLKTYDFKWKEAGTRDYGMMAHELQEVLPNYVSGEKDAINEDGSIKPQGVDYSKMVPILVKAIQELKAEIDELKNK